MEMTLRWYGSKFDTVTLEQIRQIPGVKNVITTLFGKQAGELWLPKEIAELKKIVNDAGLGIAGIESVNVSDDIKIGTAKRDEHIDNYIKTLQALGEADIHMVCYNFMPVFDWTRTQLDHVLADGSTSLVYYQEQVDAVNPLNSDSDLTLPGWDSSYTREGLKAVVAEYNNLSEEDLWNNLQYFLERVIPVAAECDVSIRPGWFYHPEEDDRVKTVDELTDLYYRSVGHNATLLLNFPVDRDGLIHPTDSANAVNFHQNVQKQLAHNLLAGLSPKASDERGRTFSAKAVTDGDYDTYWATNDDVISATIEFDLPQAEKINRMMLQEYIPLGQRVKSFVVEYNQAGEWIPVKLNEETTTIGYKRLLRFETITTDKIRVRFTDSRACLCINNIEAYYAGETSDTYTAKAAELKSYPFTLVGVDVEEAQKGMDKNDQTTCFINGNTLLIDLGEERTITSFHYLPDQSEYNKGLIAAYEISVGMDSNAVNQVVAKDEFSNIKSNPILQSVYFTPVKARYIQLKATRMIHDGEPMGLAEIGIQ